MTNLKKHMGFVHQLQLDSTPIDEATQRRYLNYNKKDTPKPKRTKLEAALGKAPMSDFNEPDILM